MSKEKQLTLMIAEIGIFSALGLVFDYVCGLISDPIWPLGGSISIAMIPICIMGYRWNILGGLITGFLVGLIQVIWGTSSGGPVQVLLDYVVPYTVIGFVGIVGSKVRKTNGLQRFLYIAIPMIIVCILRDLSHTLSGYFYWGYNTNGEGFIGSLIYNTPYVAISCLLCIILLTILVQTLGKYLNWSMDE